uniref:p2C66 n=1 Tax=Arundo donax TaxID=35708 RepID=A0A0A9ESV0_ARUDO
MVLLFNAASSSWWISYDPTVFWGDSRGNSPESRLQVRTIPPPRLWICIQPGCEQIHTFRAPLRSEVHRPVQSHQNLLTCWSVPTLAR